MPASLAGDMCAIPAVRWCHRSVWSKMVLNKRTSSPKLRRLAPSCRDLLTRATVKLCRRWAAYGTQQMLVLLTGPWRVTCALFLKSPAVSPDTSRLLGFSKSRRPDMTVWTSHVPSLPSCTAQMPAKLLTFAAVLRLSAAEIQLRRPKRGLSTHAKKCRCAGLEQCWTLTSPRTLLTQG